MIQRRAHQNNDLLIFSIMIRVHEKYSRNFGNSIIFHITIEYHIMPIIFLITKQKMRVEHVGTVKFTSIRCISRVQ